MLDFLNAMPDLTNTPEITMHEKPPTKPLAKRIRAYKAEHPNAKNGEIAKALDTTTQYVYITLRKSGSLKKKADAQPAEKPISKKQFDQLSEEIELKKVIIDMQFKRIEQLETIVEYLENKIDEINELKFG